MNKIYDILIKNLISTKDISVYLYDRAKLKSDIELNIRKTRSMVLYSDHKSRCQYASGQVWETRVDHNQRWRWNLQWNYPRLSIKSIGKPKEKTIKYKCQLCREIFGKKELKLHRCRGRIPNKTNQ